MFYATLALLASRQFSPSKHSGVIAFFHREFVKTGLISSEIVTNKIRIKAVIDPDNAISELNENNNEKSEEILVTIQSTKGILTGKVTDTEGNPVSSAIISALHAGCDKTNNNGKYTIGSLNPGSYIIWIFKCGYYSSWKVVTITEGVITTLDIILTPWPKTKSLGMPSFNEIYSILKHELPNENDFELLAFASLVSRLMNNDKSLLLKPKITFDSLKKQTSFNDEFNIRVSFENTIRASITLTYDNTKIRLIEGKENIYFANPDDKPYNIILKFKAISDNPESSITISYDVRDSNNKSEYGNETITVKEAVTLTQLLQSYPNPAGNACYIPFKLAQDSNVSLEVYNILGQKVRTIEVGQTKRGSYTKAQEGSAIFWDLKNNSGQNVSKGLYFYKLKAGDFSAVKSMIVK